MSEENGKELLKKFLKALLITVVVVVVLIVAGFGLLLGACFLGSKH